VGVAIPPFSHNTIRIWAFPAGFLPELGGRAAYQKRGSALKLFFIPLPAAHWAMGRGWTGPPKVALSTPKNLNGF